MRMVASWRAPCPAAPRNLCLARAIPQGTTRSSSGTYERLLLARRKLEVAVLEEDFASAAQYKAEAEQLEARLPASKLLLSTLLARLEAGASGGSRGSGSGSLQDKRSVVQQLGDLGDMDAAPALAARLHDAEEGLAAAAEESLWQIFMRCPSPALDDQMQQGVVLLRRPEQWGQAHQLFTDMISKAPGFAEAYNKRATVLYLQQRYAAAVADCRAVLELNPYHFAAASGMGMCCSAIGDTPGAIAAFEHAVAVNPRMKHLRQHIMQLRQLLQEEERANE